MKKKILVVEDHETVRRGIVEAINREGALEVCGEADNESSALELASSVCPNLVLIDIQLKGSNGIDLIRRLHQLDPSLPTIGMTMFDPARYERQARAAGALGFVVKQEGPEKMLAAIRHALVDEPPPSNVE